MEPMKNEMIVVDMAQYGLEELKAAEIRKDFDAVLKIAVELESAFNEVVAKPISAAVCAEAKALRLKFGKVRTGISEVHKERKAFYLSGGRAVDGLKNAYTHAVEGNEARLLEIEKHFENIEKERLQKLTDERCAVCAKFELDGSMMSLGLMTEDVWVNYIAGVELQFKVRKEAEAKAEAERIENERAEAAERERIRLENIHLKADAEAREKAAKEEAEERAREEYSRLTKEAAERKEREEKAEDERQARLKEQARIAAEREIERKEAEAKLSAERAERERLQKAQEEKEAAERKEQAEEASRVNNKKHCETVDNEAVSDLINSGLDEKTAKSILQEICAGMIRHVEIKY
jgi:hypothetical protein